MSYESVFADAKELTATERYTLAMELLKSLKTLVVEETDLKTVKKARHKAKDAEEKPKRVQTDAQVSWRAGVKYVADKGKELNDSFNYKKSLTLCAKVLVDGVNMKSLESWPEPSDEEIQSYMDVWVAETAETDAAEAEGSETASVASKGPKETTEKKRGRKKLEDMTEEELAAHKQKVEARREERKGKKAKKSTK